MQISSANPTTPTSSVKGRAGVARTAQNPAILFSGENQPASKASKIGALLKTVLQAALFPKKDPKWKQAALFPLRLIGLPLTMFSYRKNIIALYKQMNS